MDFSKFNTSNIKAVANVVIAIAALFLSGAISFPPGTSEAAKQTILAWDAWILAIVAALNGILHFMPDFTVPTTKVIPPVAKALLVGLLFAGALTLGAPQARAAGKSDTPPAPTSQIIDPLGLGTKLSGTSLATGDAPDLFTAVVNYFQQGIDSAETLSLAVPSIQDGNGHDCAVAGQTLMSVLKVHPKLISGHAAEDVEGLRITIAALHQICDNAACRQIFSEASNAIATLGIGITVPVFPAFCAKLPAVAIVPPTTPVTAATPTATPAPTPSAQ